ncbi:sigma-70 family RNA polymerase sigma factor [Marinicella sp. W31]|uniref:sigma-70 family RNA polymerase sigma factor n=1 Tax=Marinicella sp. W31 TaxID=3023713 RepID=UPI003756C0AC
MSEALDQEIYQQLKSLARKLMAKERHNHTLSATDLVHEAFVKLSVSDMSFNDQKHYFHTFTRQMRRVLVNYAHHKNSQKNKADIVLYTESLGLAENYFADFSEIDKAIDHLELLDKRSAQSIELVYFTHLSQPEIAKYLDVSLATLERDLKFGRVIIHEYLDNLE